MSKCSKISQFLSAYIDNELNAAEKEMVENHLKECTSCKQKLDMMLKTKDILKATPPIPVPETLLKDFQEYRKRSEQSEKKVVPLYKNYRVYASIAAIFVFAFVLKSGLWQEDKFMPDSLTQSKITEQSIDAPVKPDSEISAKTDSPSMASETDASKKKSDVQPAKQVQPEEKTINQPVVQDVVQDAKIPSEEPVAEVAEASIEHESSGGASDSEDLVAAPMALAREIPAADDEVPPSEDAIVYVAEEHLDKATKLLSDGEYFYAQIEQKLNDNRIPFESNFLSLDEGIPHKVVVMIKE